MFGFLGKKVIPALSVDEIIEQCAEDGSEVKLRGDEQVEYDGEVHTAANLYDALKEGYFGRY